MSKFALECPHCGTVNRASTFFLAKKKITCGNCKNDIDVKANRMAIGTCSNCGTVAFDRAKGKCPVCNQNIQSNESSKAFSLDDLKQKSSTPFFDCPECGCYIQASKQGDKLVCPACDHVFSGYEEVYSQIQKGKLVSENGVSVIKYEGGNDVFVWKHPIEDFNLGSQLIVHESQEAIFFMNGQALDLFGPGRYTLETENLPILNKVYDLPTGKQNPFHAEVYFINKTVQMGIKWGTDSRVNFIDPKSKISLSIGASGEMNLQVMDSRKLLIELVGTKKGIAWDGDSHGFARSLKMAFNPLIMTTIKTNLASVIQSQEINILEIDRYLEQISKILGDKLSVGFEEYGLKIRQFYVSNVSLPDDDPNFKAIKDLIAKAYIGVQNEEVEAEILEAKRKAVLASEKTSLEVAKLEAEKKRIMAEADAEAMKIRGLSQIELKRQSGFADADIMEKQGYDKKDVLNAEVQKAFAEGMGKMGSNGGSGGSVMSDIIGVSMGVAAAGTFQNKLGDTINSFSNTDIPPKNNGWKCSCGCESNTGKFCNECGTPKPAPVKAWECPSCKTQNTGKFCNECGTPKPAPVQAWECPSCKTQNTGKFCNECGTPKPAPVQAWECPKCKTQNTGKFCNECGTSKPVPIQVWECSKCRTKNTGKFCLECGKVREGENDE